MTRVVVVGGGIAGLSAAYYTEKYAAEAGIDLDLTLVERADQLGGKITTATPDGFIIEGGPDSFITQKPWGVELARELGLDDHLMGTNPEQHGVYVLKGGELRKMPDGMMMIVPTRFMPFVTSNLISWPGKIRMGMDLFIPPRKDESDESLADFIRRRLGQEALEVLAEPMMAGIHVSDAETLSLKATFPRFINIEQKYGSLTRGMIAARKARNAAKKERESKGGGTVSIFMTFKDGLQEFVAALNDAIQGTIITGHGVQRITQTDAGYTLDLDDGRTLEADAVVLATPAFVAANMLREVNPTLAEQLDAIRYVTTATVSLGYDADDIPGNLIGTGFVIPRNEPTRLLACTWTSNKFTHRAKPGTALLRVFVGGPRREQIVAQNDKDLIAMVRDELRDIMGITAEPTIARAFRWERGNPQYDVGHLDRIDALDAQCPPGLYLAGSAYRGVGIPDCVKQGKAAATQVIERAQQHAEPDPVTI